MTLLVLALAYIVGVWIGSMLMQAGLADCNLPGWLWMVPLVLLFLTPFLNTKAAVNDEPLRWPERGLCPSTPWCFAWVGGGGVALRADGWLADGLRTASRLLDSGRPGGMEFAE